VKRLLVMLRMKKTSEAEVKVRVRAKRVAGRSSR
jgi:hypothetical protein